MVHAGASLGRERYPDMRAPLRMIWSRMSLADHSSRRI
ncbi:Uncharacterised protein [Mycobacteroides abscessus subsp. abscessus]|nr:Uncharacterised protein [Mycobacteroides abscessus subsp. abscessus]